MTYPSPISNFLHICLLENIKRRENKAFDVTVPSGHVERFRLRLAASVANDETAGGRWCVNHITRFWDSGLVWHRETSFIASLFGEWSGGLTLIGVTTMKARLRPTHVIDHDLLEEALEVAEAVGREKDGDRRTALAQEAIRLWNEAHGRDLA